MSEPPVYQRQRNVTLPAIGAMAAGFLLGVIAKETQSTSLLNLADVASPIGEVWTNALRMIVLPLMVSYIILAINSVPQARTAGKLGGLAMIAFISMLGAAALFTLTFGGELIQVLPIDDTVRAAFKALGGTADTPVVTDSSTGPSISGWLTNMVPSNPFRAAVEDNFIGVVITTVLFALAIMQISPERRGVLLGVVEAVAEASGVFVRWIINLLPVAAFALSFVIATQTGLSIAGSLAYYMVALSAMILAVTLLLYPVTAVLGKVELRRFLGAIAPALTVGAATRSSLAALPAMLDAADNRLGIRREVSGFILPLLVSTFKLSPVISQIFELMFLMAVYRLDPSPGLLISYTVVTLILCFASAGIPSGSKLLSWPIMLAVGVPVEALVVLKVIDAIPDIFKTLLNVTADMSVTVIVQRFAGVPVTAPVPVLVTQTE
ncbi:MAG TPA: cation:dicarboxylase symporter family transporter [Rhodothermia bacterium]|nr:cation:dicarboxylase symporter family transporter [Rhodothermia bacterium]